MTTEEMKQLIRPSYPNQSHALVDPWQALADAVVVQAADDYRNAVHGRGIGHKPALQIEKECERFFQSEWFLTLSNLDGNYLMKELSKRQEDTDMTNGEWLRQLSDEELSEFLCHLYFSPYGDCNGCIGECKCGGGCNGMQVWLKENYG